LPQCIEKTTTIIQISPPEPRAVPREGKREEEVVNLEQNDRPAKKKEDQKDLGLLSLGICRRKTVTGSVSLVTISTSNTGTNATGVKKKKNSKNNLKSILRIGNVMNVITSTLQEGSIAISAKVNGRL